MDRAPGVSVRLKLTLSYAGFLVLAGALLLALWVVLMRIFPRAPIIRATRSGIGGAFAPGRSPTQQAFGQAGVAVLAFLLVFGLAGGWILAGRSRTGQRSFSREHVDLSLIAEEATETLLPLADKRGVTVETSGDITPTAGCHALLLQMTTNLLHNAIVHNLPEHGTVQLSTATGPESVILTVENTGGKLAPQLVSTLTEPFQRGAGRMRGDHAGAGLGLAIVKSITQAHDGTLTLAPRAAGGLCVTAELPVAAPHTGR